MATEKRLISVNELEKRKTILWDEALGFCDCVLIEDIYNAPRADAVEVVHGRWENKRMLVGGFREVWGFDCSVCGETVKDLESPYCPNCGAKMDGDGNG